jgi:hypothetical protein
MAYGLFGQKIASNGEDALRQSGGGQLAGGPWSI